MTEQYRVSTGPGPTTPTKQAGGRGILRPVLWALLIVSAAANGISQAAGLHVLVGIGFGVATLALIAALVVHHYRHRR